MIAWEALLEAHLQTGEPCVGIIADACEDAGLYDLAEWMREPKTPIAFGDRLLVPFWTEEGIYLSAIRYPVGEQRRKERAG